jgi:hypothetical protein
MCPKTSRNAAPPPSKTPFADTEPTHQLIIRILFFSPDPHRFRQLLETLVQDRIPCPVGMVEVPPFEFVDREAFGLECAPQENAVPALE